MDLRETILDEHSKSQAEKIIKWVGRSQSRFDELFNLFIYDKDARVIQRSGWPLSNCVIKYPSLIDKHFNKLISNLDKKDLHPAVKRNTVRILEHATIPKRYHGRIMTICFSYIESNDETAATKVFSLGVLENLLPHYPGIKNELKLIIEERWPHETPAFYSRAKKILKKINS